VIIGFSERRCIMGLAENTFLLFHLRTIFLRHIAGSSLFLDFSGTWKVGCLSCMDKKYHVSYKEII
jgi:hypothetical protein